MSRTDEEIEAGKLPGVQHITLGGVKYPALEPTNARARLIRRAITEYEENRVKAGKDNGQQIDLIESMMDTCIRNFSDEVEADWERIAATATDRERLETMLVIRDSVMVAFQTLVGAVTPVGNRKARRAKTAKK